MRISRTVLNTHWFVTGIWGKNNSSEKSTCYTVWGPKVRNPEPTKGQTRGASVSHMPVVSWELQQDPPKARLVVRLYPSMPVVHGNTGQLACPATLCLWASLWMVRGLGIKSIDFTSTGRASVRHLLPSGSPHWAEDTSGVEFKVWSELKPPRDSGKCNSWFSQPL